MDEDVLMVVKLSVIKRHLGTRLGARTRQNEATSEHIKALMRHFGVWTGCCLSEHLSSWLKSLPPLSFKKPMVAPTVQLTQPDEHANAS